MKIYTIGHSTRSIEDFISLLENHDINMIIDIRRGARSKFDKDFEGENIQIKLAEKNIGYIHSPLLENRNMKLEDDKRKAFNNTQLQGFTDYMDTENFRKGLGEVKIIAQKYKTALMCIEALPRNCHRTLIADLLTSEKIKVFHIVDFGKIARH